jgi:hypothetical protein
VDAEAIAEAVEHKNMRFVPIKTDDQVDLHSLHRVRECWVVRQTAVINQIAECFWSAVSPSVKDAIILRGESLPGILEDADNKLSGALRALLTQLRIEMQYLHGQIEETDKLIARICGELEQCRRLVAIPGIGLEDDWMDQRIRQVLLTLGIMKGGNSEAIDYGDVGAVHLQDNSKVLAVWRGDDPVEILVFEVECPDDLA